MQAPFKRGGHPGRNAALRAFRFIVRVHRSRVKLKRFCAQRCVKWIALLWLYLPRKRGGRNEKSTCILKSSNLGYEDGETQSFYGKSTQDARCNAYAFALKKRIQKLTQRAGMAFEHTRAYLASGGRVLAVAIAPKCAGSPGSAAELQTERKLRAAKHENKHANSIGKHLGI